MYIELKRPAIAMIELIFAIVIMGIVMMSAPMLISTSAKSTSVALQQEGINEAVSRVSMILTHEWDQHDTNVSCLPPVLHVSSAGDVALKEVNTTTRRVGVPLQTKSRTFHYACNNSELNATATLGIEGTVIDDIDDFTNTSLIEDLSGSGGKDYIEKTTVNIATSIYYTPDIANYSSSSVAYSFTPGSTSSSSTNIKAIQVTLTSTSGIDELEKTIVLNAFSCNTGGPEFQSRGL